MMGLPDNDESRHRWSLQACSVPGFNKYTASILRTRRPQW
jgi:hypothetical protein